MGLKGNFISWKEFLKVPQYIKFLKNDRSNYRVYNFITQGTQNFFSQTSSLLENKNIIYDIASIGIYAPIIHKDYYQMLSDLGAIDDSLGRTFTDKSTLKKNLGLLSFLNVKYIISYKDLSNIGGLKEVYSEGKVKIYQLDSYMPLVFFAREVRVLNKKEEILNLIKDRNYNPQEYVTVLSSLPLGRIEYPQRFDIRIEEERENKVIIDIRVDSSSFLVISKSYLGWRAYIDNKEVKLYPVNLIAQGVLIPAGKHRLKLMYSPYS
jgi:uncharacterized membrane protein YfhO